MYRERTYSSDVSKFALWAIGWAALVTAIRFSISPPADFVAAVRGFVIFGAGLSLVLVALVFVCKVSVGRDGVRGYDTLGRFREVPWGEMESARVVRLLLVPYLYVRCPRMKFTLTVPLWINGLGEFIETVNAYAPPENPLRQGFNQLGRKTGA